MTTSTRMASPDILSEPTVFNQSEYDHDTLLAQMGGWKVYEENKSHWSEAWNQYYDIKTANLQTSWAKYEQSKDDVERKWQEAKSRRPSTASNTGTPSPKLPYGLSVETDLAAAAKRWSKPERVSRSPDNALPKPQT